MSSDMDAIRAERNALLDELEKIDWQVRSLNWKMGFSSGSPTYHDPSRLAYCEFYVRTFNCLNKAGYRYVFEVDMASDAELLAIPNLGRGSLRDIREVLSSHIPRNFPGWKPR